MLLAMLVMSLTTRPSSRFYNFLCLNFSQMTELKRHMHLHSTDSFTKFKNITLVTLMSTSNYLPVLMIPTSIFNNSYFLPFVTSNIDHLYLFPYNRATECLPFGGENLLPTQAYVQNIFTTTFKTYCLKTNLFQSSLSNRPHLFHLTTPTTYSYALIQL